MTDAPVATIDRPRFLAAPAVAAVLAALPGARAVGGCVRDALAGRENADVDVGAPLPPEDIATRLRAAGLKVFETGLAHGTVTAVLDHAPVEVTALRRDVLTDGRHATVAWTTDWREDAARRDFTINAMSLTPDGALFDYFTGRADLAAGRVRFVGDPDTRLAEDYLRALRFFRFQARYGVGEPDAAAVAAIGHAVPGLKQLSAERVWMELKRILSVPDPVAAVGLMARTGVLGAVLPEAAEVATLATLIAVGAPPDPLLRVAALLRDPIDGDRVDRVRKIARDLRLSGAEAAALRAITRPPAQARLHPGMTARDLRVALAEAGEPAGSAADHDPRGRLVSQARLAAARAMREGDAGLAQRWLALAAALQDAPMPDFPLAGRDVVALGVDPGRAVGAWLGALRAWWLDGGCTATRAEALGELARRITAGSAAVPAGHVASGDDGGTGSGGGTALGG
jgi:poly(A) polymerase/tRNA nucleotidyltransferase (CCA-adding enzyme)